MHPPFKFQPFIGDRAFAVTALFPKAEGPSAAGRHIGDVTVTAFRKCLKTHLFNRQRRTMALLTLPIMSSFVVDISQELSAN